MCRLEEVKVPESQFYSTQMWRMPSHCPYKHGIHSFLPSVHPSFLPSVQQTPSVCQALDRHYRHNFELNNSNKKMQTLHLLLSLRTKFWSFCIPLVFYPCKQLGVTYLVTHHLMSKIPLAPCQAKLINIFLHFKKICKQQATCFLYVCARIKYTKPKGGHLFSERFQNGGTKKDLLGVWRDAWI